MDVYEAVNNRKTIRDFEDREIPKGILLKLLDAGFKAPSNDHLRKWEFLVIDDKAKRKELIENIGTSRTKESALKIVDDLGMVEPSQREMYIDAIPKQYSMILESGSLIIPCFHGTGPLLKPENLSSLNSFASIWCCIENILICAASEGIYGVTRIPTEEERLRMKELLSIPNEYEVPCYLAMGYPKKNARRAKQYEIKLEDKIHNNGW
jgi:nitroreductase